MQAEQIRRFKMDLAGLHALCEANYARLMRLFPDYARAQSREFSVAGAQVSIEVLERCRYTTVFCLHQRHGASEWLGQLRIELRAYHDASMLEVGAFQSHRRIAPRYQYPNRHMYQQDEKLQQNQFLADWLAYCLGDGQAAASGYSWSVLP